MHDENEDEPSVKIPNGPVEPRTGYKVPPAAHRFEKGTSGNAGGRPKGAKSKGQIAGKVLMKVHEVTEGDRKVKYTALELIVIALRNMSSKGNSKAFKDLQKLESKYNPEPPRGPGYYLTVPGHLDKEAWRAIYENKSDPMQREE